jgi:hypothetical protein
MDIAAQVASRENRISRQVVLDARESEHGGLIPADRVSEVIKRSMAGWSDSYRPSTTKTEVSAAVAGTIRDCREVTIGRLYVDLSKMVDDAARKFSTDDRETIRTEALLLLLRWPSHGAAGRTLDLGAARLEARMRRIANTAPTAALRCSRWIDLAEILLANGSLPLRRDWIDPATGYASDAARRAMRAAIKQAAADRQVVAELAPAAEIPTDGLDISRMIEAEAISSAEAIRIPDAAAPEIIAAHMRCSLDAARAILARAYPAANVTELAASWRISRAAADNALNRGAAWIRANYPDPIDLLTALDAAAASYRDQTERDALLALLDYREYRDARDLEAAKLAVANWRGASAGLSTDQGAILSAARAAIRRHGGQYGSELAERIAASAPRLIAAEQRATSRSSRVKRYGHLNHCALSAQRRRAAHMNPQQLVKLTHAREQLSRFLDSGSADADRMRALRAEIAALAV